MRAFIAIPLPGPIKKRLCELQATLQGNKAEDGKQAGSKEDKKKRESAFKASWVNAETLHLTLNFFGEIEPSLVDVITPAMQEAAAGCGPFNLTIGGLRGFPNLKVPRTLWLALKEEHGLERLRELKSRLDTALKRAGLDIEERAFKPHLTLCRIKHRDEGRRAAAQIAGIPKSELPGGTEKKGIDFIVDTFVLFSSALEPGGAVHTPLFTATLNE
ncbi:MAG: RNA 2',3'-cyclic phosphodiesterase [Proteobacteria bacterium]|nr:RNA 2',3'-cyclic phosphodiesterase [Pseudomonadota bacterium]